MTTSKDLPPLPFIPEIDMAWIDDFPRMRRECLSRLALVDEAQAVVESVLADPGISAVTVRRCGDALRTLGAARAPIVEIMELIADE